MKKVLLLLPFLLATVYFQAQNVGIGTASPDQSALLEVQSTSKGMLVPRVALTAANVAAPVTAPANALLLYNTATAGAGENAVQPGFYYWSSSSSRWVGLSAGAAPNGSVGFGTWGDCSMNNVSEHNPVTADDGVANDNFGFSVSVSGNYAIIGAIGDESNRGAAYIYFYNGTAWVQQQKLTANDGAADDNFGYSVYMEGNYAIVGAPADDAYKGSAYVFFFNGSTWSQQQKLTASDGAADDRFGIGVSLSSARAIIGAVGDDAYKGSAYIFNLVAGTWQQLPKLTASDGGAGDYFGFSVSMSGNYAIVGAPFDETQRGGTYIYFYNGANWTQLPKITAADGLADDNFGYSVSISGNYAIIGAARDELNAGSAYIYFFNGVSWSQLQKLSAPDAAPDDNFGGNVQLSGSYALVGALSKDLLKGAVYIYQNINGFWNLLQKVTRPGANPDDRFGASCGGDNNKRFIIGAYHANNRRGIVHFGKID